MNCVKSRKGGPIYTPPPLKASCNYFFFEASRVKIAWSQQCKTRAIAVGTMTDGRVNTI